MPNNRLNAIIAHLSVLWTDKFFNFIDLQSAGKFLIAGVRQLGLHVKSFARRVPRPVGAPFPVSKQFCLPVQHPLEFVNMS